MLTNTITMITNFMDAATINAMTQQKNYINWTIVCNVLFVCITFLIGLIKIFPTPTAEKPEKHKPEDYSPTTENNTVLKNEVSNFKENLKASTIAQNENINNTKKELESAHKELIKKFESLQEKLFEIRLDMESKIEAKDIDSIKKENIEIKNDYQALIIKIDVLLDKLLEYAETQ